MIITSARKFTSKLFTPALNLNTGGLFAAAIIFGAMALHTGCASAPNAVEAKFFDLVTNQVPRVVYATNVVTLTNTALVTNEIVITRTNEANVVIPIYSNVVQVIQVPVYQTNIVPIATNLAEVVSLGKPSALSGGVAGAATAAGTPFGIPFAGAVFTTLLGLYGTWRNNRIAKVNGQNADTATATAETFSQIIEVGREVLSSKLGQQAADVWKNWMVSHQVSQGVITSATEIVQNAVDNPAAKETANQLLSLMTQVQGGGGLPGQGNAAVPTARA